jgi:hypothetical protein
MGGDAVHGSQVRPFLRHPMLPPLLKSFMRWQPRGYLESCRSIVSCAKTIERTIKSDIPELYVLGSPPASVVAFASRLPPSELNILEVGDNMSMKGWHLNAIINPPGLHIACTVSISNISLMMATMVVY